MTVVSELLPLLVLEAPLLATLIFSTLSTTSSIVLPRRAEVASGTRSTETSVLRDGGGTLVDVALVVGAARRRGAVSAAAALVAKDGAMEDIDGRRSVLRRATEPLSSACLRPGEFWDVLDGSGRLSAKTSIAERRLV